MGRARARGGPLTTGRRRTGTLAPGCDIEFLTSRPPGAGGTRSHTFCNFCGQAVPCFWSGQHIAGLIALAFGSLGHDRSLSREWWTRRESFRDDHRDCGCQLCGVVGPRCLQCGINGVLGDCFAGDLQPLVGGHAHES